MLLILQTFASDARQNTKGIANKENGYATRARVGVMCIISFEVWCFIDFVMERRRRFVCTVGNHAEILCKDWKLLFATATAAVILYLFGCWLVVCLKQQKNQKHFPMYPV
jgi:hypothetical protein